MPTPAEDLDTIDDTNWHATFDIGTLSAVKCVQAALPLLRKAEWARIAATEGEAPGESGLDKRFRALCHRALAPTRAYFEKRGELRAQRTTELEAFLADVPEGIVQPEKLGRFVRIPVLDDFSGMINFKCRGVPLIECSHCQQ